MPSVMQELDYSFLVVRRHWKLTDVFVYTIQCIFSEFFASENHAAQRTFVEMIETAFVLPVVSCAAFSI